MSNPSVIIVMGVSGSGKSTIAEGVARELGFHFRDGDDFHSDENRAAMKAKQPLTDSQRQPWLTAIRDYANGQTGQGESVVIACSSLKVAYRDLLRTTNAPIYFVLLDGEYDLIYKRMQNREHFFDAGMLQSQFDAMEFPTGEDDVAIVSIDNDVQTVVGLATHAVRATLAR